MPNNDLSNSFSIFGAALDASDIDEAIKIKQAYLTDLSTNNRPLLGLRDPYDYFKSIIRYDKNISKDMLLGRFLIETSLSPKPDLSDTEMINKLFFKQFYLSDGFSIYSKMLKQFVEAHVFPEKPFMIGVDHSLTGGVLTALSKRVGIDDLGVIVFDCHTDAIPLCLRKELVEYAFDKGIPAPSPNLKPQMGDYYTTGNFLLKLIENAVIKPNNIVIVGPADTSSIYKKLKDERVRNYVRHYEQLMSSGVKIIEKQQMENTGHIKKILDKMKCSNLYVSLDVDVCAQCGVLATRYLQPKGSPISTVLKQISAIRELIRNKPFSLVGFDIMEIDIYKVDAKLNSGNEDFTGDLMKKYTSALIDLA